MLRPGRSASLPTNYVGSNSHTMNGVVYGGYSGGNANGGHGYSNGAPAYGGYSSNAYGGYGEFKDKRPKRVSPDPVSLILSYLKKPMVLAILVAFALFSSTLHYRGQRNWILRVLQVRSTKDAVREVDFLKEEHEHMEEVVAREISRAEREAKIRVTRLERQNRQLQEERDELLAEHESPKTRSKQERYEARENAWKKQVQLLQKATARESKRAATEKFGPGPHHVEFSVVLPDDEEKERHFVVEMAPLDSMPHAVHLFLEQVDHGLWNEAQFYLNGPHVLQGGPSFEEGDEDETEEEARARRLLPFRKLQLDNLVFPEYSEDFPHVQWTLGLTGRPGGPDFYINKADNTRSHGPGGQSQHDLEEFADPCFAKVVDGFDVLNDVFAVETVHDDPDYEWFFEEPVYIVHAEIMEEPPANLAEKTEEKGQSKEESKAEPPKDNKNWKRGKVKKPVIDHQVEP